MHSSKLVKSLAVHTPIQYLPLRTPSFGETQYVRF